MNKRFVRIFALMLTIVTVFSITAFAQNTKYGDYGSVTINKDDGWKTAYSIYDTKAYANVNYGKIDVSYKSMWSSPSARIVDAGGNIRSTETKIGNLSNSPFLVELLGTSVKTTYYLSIKAAPTQTGTDTVTARINVG